MADPAAPDQPTDWDDPLCLAEGVALIVGANEEHLLFREATGVYVRISPNAVSIIEELHEPIAVDHLVEVVANRLDFDPKRVRQRVLPFLTELRQANMLTNAPSTPKTGDRLAKSARHAPIKRLRVLRSVDAIFDPAARLLRRTPRRALGAAGASAVAVAILLIVVGIGGLSGSGLDSVTWPWPIVLVLIGLLTHESAHALACRYYGVHVREAGLGLWYYFIPIAYVDRTDAYRLRSRWGRTLIALAGPLNDVFWSAGCFAVAGATTGSARATLQATGVLFLTVVVSNLNPLLPTDGHQAVESAAGELNFRGRAMEYVTIRLLRRPLPSYHRSINAGRRRAYLIFGAASLVYLLAMFGAFLLLGARLVSEVL